MHVALRDFGSCPDGSCGLGPWSSKLSNRWPFVQTESEELFLLPCCLLRCCLAKNWYSNIARYVFCSRCWERDKRKKHFAWVLEGREVTKRKSKNQSKKIQEVPDQPSQPTSASNDPGVALNHKKISSVLPQDGNTTYQSPMWWDDLMIWMSYWLEAGSAACKSPSWT